MIHASLAVWTLAVMASDWRRRRVPNPLVAGALLAVLACWTFTGAGPRGGSGPADALVALCIAPPLIACFRAGWIGGGDLKFLVLLPLLGGARLGLLALVLGGLLAGAWAALLVGARGARRGSFPLAVPYGAAFLLALGAARGAQL